MAVARQAARRRVDAARREMYRGLVLEAAEAVFAENGFTDAKMSDIALEAGIALKTLYSVFEGKLELYEAITQLRCEELLALIPADTDDPPLAAVMEGVRASVAYLLEHPNFLRMHLREGNAWAVQPEADATDGAQSWQEGLRQQALLIQRGIDAGVFVDEDPQLMTKLITAVYQVYLADWLERGEAGDPAELTRHIQRHVQHLMCGAAGPPGGDAG